MAQAIDETLSSRALYGTVRPRPEILPELRQRMLEEKNASLERAQELVREIKKQKPSL